MAAVPSVARVPNWNATGAIAAVHFLPRDAVFACKMFQFAPPAQGSSTSTADSDFFFDLAGSDDQVKEKAAEAIVETLQNQAVIDEARSNIDRLTRVVRDIKYAFITISGKLRQFDNERFEDGRGNRLRLNRTWASYRQRFNKLIDESHDNAASAAVFMRQYSHVLLSDEQEDSTRYKKATCMELKIELRYLIKRLEEKKKKAQEAKTGFSKLASEISAFVFIMEQALQQGNEHLREELDARQSQLDILTDEMKGITRQISSLGTAAMKSLGAGAEAAVFALQTLSPHALVEAITAAIQATGEGFQYLNAKHTKSRLTAKIASTQDEIEVLRQRQQLLVHYTRELTLAKGQIREVSKQIDTISSIWQILRVDMGTLCEQVSLMAEPEAPVTAYFRRKMTVAAEVYRHLAMLLETYVKYSEFNDTCQIPCS